MKLEWKTCFRIGVSLFLLFLGITYWPGVVNLVSIALGAAAPLMIGCVVAYLLNILMGAYEQHYFPKWDKKKWVQTTRRPVCMIGAMVTLIAIVALVIGLVLPQFISCIQLLFAEIPPAMDALLDNQMLMELLPKNWEATLSSIDWQNLFSKLLSYVTAGLGGVMGFTVSAVSGVFSSFVTAFLSIIFAIYLLLGKERLCAQTVRVMRSYVKPAWCRKMAYVLSVCNDSFRSYIVGQCTEAVILGTLCMVGMLILQLPYASMIGALIGLTALIPVAGAYIGAGVGAIMILTVSPVKAVVFLIFIVILQQLEGNLIYPRVVGSSVGLPGLWVLAAVTIGGGISGVFGMLIGVPITAALYRMLREDVNKREAGQKAREGVKQEQSLAESSKKQEQVLAESSKKQEQSLAESSEKQEQVQTESSKKQKQK